jgi:hypothetical protein
MISRYLSLLFIAGALAWILKTVLIWINGGTNTTGGLVGILFIVGALSLAVASAIRAWYLPRTLKVWPRVLATLASLIVLVLMVDLPILIGWQLFGHTWVAEELGIVLTALVALVIGVRGLFHGFPKSVAANYRTTSTTDTSADI